jgi:hypothetical protein
VTPGDGTRSGPAAAFAIGTGVAAVFNVLRQRRLPGRNPR